MKIEEQKQKIQQMPQPTSNKTAWIHARTEPSIVILINTYAKSRGLSRSRAVNELIMTNPNLKT